MPNFSTISHLDITVTEAEASAEWYQKVLGLKRLARSEPDGRIMVVLLHEASGLVIGLNQHPVPGVPRFDERNPGLDHVGFAVGARSELDEWERRLTELGVEHSPVTDAPGGSGTALVFRDPDNVQLEFWWTAPRG